MFTKYVFSTGVICQESVNECESSPCQNGGFCSDLVSSYSCLCRAGFTGSHCETNIDECAQGLCQNAINCVDKVSRKCLAKLWQGCRENITEMSGVSESL